MRRRMVILLAMFMVIVLLLTACTNANDPVNVKKTAEVTAPSQEDSVDEDLPDNFNKEGYPIVNKKITVNMMGFKHPIQGPWEELKFFKAMEDMTNISFTFDTPPHESYEERKNLAFASGEVPDVFFGGMLNPQQEVKYGAEGVLIPLEDLIEKFAPNVKQMFAAMPEVKKSLIAPDGHIYSLPNINTAPIAFTSTMWVNGPWMEAMGVAELPDTTEELYELLKRIKNEDLNGNGEADEIPLGIHGKSWELNNFILPAFGIITNKIYVENNKVSYGYLEPNYKEFVKYTNQLWNEGLIDPDAFSQGYAELAAKGKAEKVGMGAHAIPQLIFDCAASEDAIKYPALPALSSSINPDTIFPIGTGINRGAFAITSRCEYPEAMIRWVDWLYSEEGSIFVHYGEENDLWKFNDKGMREYIQPEDGRNTEEVRGGEITPDCGTPLPKWVRDDTEGSWDDVFQQFRIGQTDQKLYPYGKVAYPDVYQTEEEQKRLDILLTDIDKYTESMEAKFVTGEATLDEYDKFVDTLKDMGIEEVIQIYQASYDRWNNAD